MTEQPNGFILDERVVIGEVGGFEPFSADECEQTSNFKETF